MNDQPTAQLQLRKAYEIGAAARAGEPISLIDALNMKRALRQALPKDAAFDAYRDALGLGASVRLERRPIQSLLAAARSEATEFHLFHPGGQSVVCAPPEVIGPGVAPGIKGVTRTVFVACFENAIAHSRSSVTQLGSELCFDIEPQELASLPIDLAFDSVVFDRDGGMIDAIIDTRPATVLKVDRAISLMGINVVSFGHWLIEGVLQFAGILKELRLEGTPLLIDQQMPPQHRQSLELLGRNRFPIIEVPRWTRVEARKLWRASNWFYSPHLLLTDQGLNPKHLVMPMKEAGAVYRFAGAIMDEALGIGASDRRTFLARPVARHRRIVNFDEIAAFLESQEFVTYFPEYDSFSEQMRNVRQSGDVVLQSGSAAHSLLFLRAGAKACYLSHPAFPIIALYAELLKQVGVEMKIVSGPFETRTEPYLDQSDYRIPLERLRSVIEQWMYKSR